MRMKMKRVFRRNQIIITTLAIMIAAAGYLNLDPEGTATVLHGREGLCGKRKPEEIGVFSLRGGTVAGEHTVYFFGEDETLQITHRAASRRIFAAGALRAAQAICGRGPGFYTLDELLFEI